MSVPEIKLESIGPDPGRQSDHALSYCLFYNQGRWDPDKHLTPLATFLRKKIHIKRGKDVLMFLDADFPEELTPDLPGCRIFRVSGFVGWRRHLMRYLAADPGFGYEWVQFCGTDTPDPGWLCNVKGTCQVNGHPIGTLLQTGHSVDTLISGSLVANTEVLPALHQAVLQAHYNEDLIDRFNLDETFLTEWYLQHNWPLVVYAQDRLINYRMQAWMMERFYKGPSLIYIGRSNSPSGHISGKLMI